jgi:hypothetical protein
VRKTDYDGASGIFVKACGNFDYSTECDRKNVHASSKKIDWFPLLFKFLPLGPSEIFFQCVYHFFRRTLYFSHHYTYKLPNFSKNVKISDSIKLLVLFGQNMEKTPDFSG